MIVTSGQQWAREWRFFGPWKSIGGWGDSIISALYARYTSFINSHFTFHASPFQAVSPTCYRSPAIAIHDLRLTARSWERRHPDCIFVIDSFRAGPSSITSSFAPFASYFRFFSECGGSTSLLIIEAGLVESIYSRFTLFPVFILNLEAAVLNRALSPRRREHRPSHKNKFAGPRQVGVFGCETLKTSQLMNSDFGSSLWSMILFRVPLAISEWFGTGIVILLPFNWRRIIM